MLSTAPREVKRKSHNLLRTIEYRDDLFCSACVLTSVVGTEESPCRPAKAVGRHYISRGLVLADGHDGVAFEGDEQDVRGKPVNPVFLFNVVAHLSNSSVSRAFC